VWVGVVEGGIGNGVPIGVYCVINVCLIKQQTFPCDMLWCVEGGTTRACECFWWVHRLESFGIGAREGVINCKLECRGCGVLGVEQVFGLLTMLIFLHINSSRPEWVVMGGWAIKEDMCVCVSIGVVAGDCHPEITDAVFPVEIHLPIKEGSCTCLVFLKCSVADDSSLRQAKDVELKGM
jgi:hypothetical protein